MPPKRTKKADRLHAEQPVPKKPKTDDGQLDGQCTHSPYTTADLWQKMAFYVQKEIFCYMDIRVGNKNCRVSKSWKSQLVGTKGMNNGIAFLDWRVAKKTRVMMNKKFGQAASWPWRSFFQLDLSEVTQFVSVGEEMTTSHYKKTGKVFAATKQPLEKVTFWGGKFNYCEVVGAAHPLEDKGIKVQLLKCAMDFGEYRFHFPKALLQINMARFPLTFSWLLPVDFPRLVFDERFKQARTETQQLRWLFRLFDQANLIWPYGEDQVEWLRNALESLGSAGGNPEVWKAVEVVYVDFLRWSMDFAFSFRVAMKNCETKVGLFRIGDMRTLSCAFLARLIVGLPEDKRPQGWKPPPHPIPELPRGVKPGSNQAGQCVWGDLL